jgi:hypothetical protein
MGIGGFGTGPASKSATELRPGGRAAEVIRLLHQPGQRRAADVREVGQIAERWGLDRNHVAGGGSCDLPDWKHHRVDAAAAIKKGATLGRIAPSAYRSLMGGGSGSVRWPNP